MNTVKRLFMSFMSITLLVSMNIIAMDSSRQIEFRQATHDDVGDLLNLIEAEGIKDRDKIVILPKIFRQGAIEGTIAQQRMFIARDQQTGKLVGYKKLFVMEDQEEQVSTLANEIRCAGDGSIMTHAGSFDIDGYGYSATDTDERVTYKAEDLYLYNGGDFTHPEYRGNGLNKRLTDAALALVKQGVCAAIKQQAVRNLVMVYGLTEANAGNAPADRADRTSSIVRSFVPFAQQVQQECYPDTPRCAVVRNYRYRAFMPTFDLDATECRPLPDEQSVPGYGCALIYPLDEQKHQEETGE